MKGIFESDLQLDAIQARNLLEGRADSGRPWMVGYPIEGTLVAAEAFLRTVDAGIDPGPYGIGLRKDDTELQSVLQEALREIVADGSYDRVLTKWNVTDGALKTANVTGAP